MARKKKKKINPLIFKYAIIGFVSLAGISVVCLGIYKLASESTLFNIKEVRIDDSVSFINEDIFRKIKGENIFRIDLQKLQRRLAFRYPQISDLKVLRLFPDRLLITARKRLPFLQTMISNLVVTLDDDGVVISTKSKRDTVIPFVLGIDERNTRVALGRPLRSKLLKAVLEIVKRFQSNENLSGYDVEKIKVESLSRIHLYLSNDLRVLMDAQQVNEKLLQLGLFLSSKKIDISSTQYIDLRYKDIIVKERAL